MTTATRSTADVEELLRRTYTEVADRTTVEPIVTHGDARVVPISTASPARWRPVAVAAAAAAVAALLVGGLAVLTARDGDAPAAPGAPTHVVVGTIPIVGGDIHRRYPLTELISMDGYDRLVYATGDASVTIEIGGLDALPDGDSFDVRGTVGRRTDDSLHWYGPGGRVVSVRWTGAVDPGLPEAIAGSMVYVDDDVWTELTSHGGFRLGDDPLVTWRIEADEDFEVELRGDLHDGIRLWSGSGDFRIGIDDCSIVGNGQTTEYPEFPEVDPTTGVTGYQVLVPGRVDVATIRVDGRPDRTIGLTSLAPVLDVSIGGAVYDGLDPSSEPPGVRCGEVQR